MAVIHRDGDMIGDLVKHSRNQADVNLADSNGMTPLMHAVKTNDVVMVLRLLHKDGELPKDAATNDTLSMDKVIRNDTLSMDKIIRKGSFVTSGVNVGAQDNRGYNAIHHLVELEITASGMRATYDNADMLSLLTSAGVDAAATVDGNGNKSALQMAEEAGAENLAAKLSSLLGRGSVTEAKRPSFEAPVVEDGLDWDGEFGYDVVADAQCMLAQLEAEADKNPRRRQKGKVNGSLKQGGLFSAFARFGSGRPKMAVKRAIPSLFRSSSEEEEDDDDEDEEMDEDDTDESEEESEDVEIDETGSVKDETTKKPEGCIVKQGGTLHGGYTVLMTKIDVSMGAFGMYNFYRMQGGNSMEKNPALVLA